MNENENKQLVGRLIGNEEMTYRVLYDDGKYCVVCQTNTSKLVLIQYSSLDLAQQVRNGIYKIIKEPTVIINPDNMSEKEREKFEYKKKLMKKVSDYYGPSYIGLIGKSTKTLIDEIIEIYSIPRNSLWRLIRLYLQSGCQPFSLADLRTINTPSEKRKLVNYSTKTGRPTKSGLPKGIILTNEIREQFEEALQQYKKGREMTFKNAYLGLIDKYYSEIKNGNRVLMPEHKRPTYRQFYYYCHTHLTKMELDEIKTSRMEQCNAKRLLFGSSRKDAIRPGWIVEVDALEVDVSIASVLNPEQSVGRPIVYFMTDVYSSMIVAASVSFENNSMVGLTNLLCNLADDKTEYCEKHGFKLNAYNYWKSNFIPHEMRCDRGSDFMSNKFEEVCNRLGIQRTLVPAGTGSLKGIVEQSFHQFQTTFRPQMESKGLITKRYDSKHHQEAILNIDDFEQMLITFILEHNRKSIDNYPMSKEMIKQNIIPSPVNLWNYGCNEFGEPTPITSANRNQFIFDLMPEVKASLSRKGITYKGLNYISTDTYLLTEMYNLGTKRKKFTIRFDPRNVSHVYYMGENNQLCVADLNLNIPNMGDFVNMTWFEYEQCLEKKKELIAEGKEQNIQIDYDQFRINSTIIDFASSNTVTVSAKNLREARSEEKQRRNVENSLHEHINKATEVTLPEPDKKDTPKLIKKSTAKPKQKEKIQDTFLTIEVDFDKALEDFEDEN